MFFAYIVTNRRRGVLYTGHTDDLARRVWLHKTHALKGSFSDRYNCERLVWFETFDTRDAARTREKQIKNWKRDWKVSMIERVNPEWRSVRPPI